MGAAQGALRDIIGRNDLATLLSQRRELDAQLTVILDEQTEPWGIKVESVQLQDIKVPDNLQDALSRMAQAERERQARVILGESEVSVARMFAEAGEVYRLHPTALHLRGMNMLYETMRSGRSQRDHGAVLRPGHDEPGDDRRAGQAGPGRDLGAPLAPPDGGGRAERARAPRNSPARPAQIRARPAVGPGPLHRGPVHPAREPPDSGNRGRRKAAQRHAVTRCAWRRS